MKLTGDVVIGLEIHVELDTNTKLFCGCTRKRTEIPNTNTCPICLGHPGTKPMLNEKALHYAIKLCLAVGSKITKKMIFSRKSYFYPDMSKNFQITQFEEPLGTGGEISLKSGKKINLTRLHMEEDPAAIVYPKSMANSTFVMIDYNRSGDPLVEVVTEPELHSPEEAREFLNHLISILSYLQIFDINTCIIKTDANISIKESGYSRVEIKNITGFKELERALNYEIERQRKLIKKGGNITQETRGWDAAIQKTKLQRTKETEADYGYIIEPDLSIIEIKKELVENLQEEIPELAHEKAERYVKEFGIDPIDAQVMAMEREIAEIFEEIIKTVDPDLTAKWLRRELLKVLNFSKKTIRDVNFGTKELTEVLELIAQNKISDKVAKEIIQKLVEKPFSPKEYVKKKGLEQVSSRNKVKEFCVEVISKNKNVVEDYKNGEEKALNFLVGQVMRMTKGKADPKVTAEIMKKEINSE